MTLELINPDDLPTPASYNQVIAATGRRLVFVAGQVADDAQGNLVATACCPAGNSMSLLLTWNRWVFAHIG
jgi:enamine deaminase RidA (YjgF/YER057c/UK114 family)